MRRLALSFLLIIAGTLATATTFHFPALTGRVVDAAHILSPTAQQYLSEKLEAYERGTTNQVAVVTLSSLEGDSVEDYSNLLFRQWALGQKGKDNGVLLAVAPNERKVHIEVGYRLEPTLTDAASSQIINDIILPAFKDGDMERGIVNGTQAIIGVLGGHSISVSHQPHYAGQQQSTPLQSVIGFIVLIFFVIFAIRHPFLAMLLMSNSRFGGSSGSSSWGGGDDDHFSGGGGSAGGGGASGSW